MKEFLDKIESYHIFNYLIPGSLFVVLLPLFTPYSLPETDPVIAAIVYYFIGMVISRVGSLLIEPLFKRIGFIKSQSHEYKDFVRTSKHDPKLETLSEINNTFRSLCSLFPVLFLVEAYTLIEHVLPIIVPWRMALLFITLFFLFAFSYRKQSKYISDRIKAHHD